MAGRLTLAGVASDTSDDLHGPSKLTIARWIAAGVVVLATLALSIVSASGGRFAVCEDVVAQVGPDALARSCRPLQATDAPVLTSILLFVLLILPDFSKISIAGFLDLERRVEVQVERTREVEKALHQLQANVQLASLQQRTTVNVGREFLRPDESVDEALPDLERKGKEFSGDN